MIRVHRMGTPKFALAGDSPRWRAPVVWAALDPGLLIAQVTHGPGGGMAVAHLALVAIIVVGGLAFVVARRHRGPDNDAAAVTDREPDSDRGPEA